MARRCGWATLSILLLGYILLCSSLSTTSATINNNVDDPTNQFFLSVVYSVTPSLIRLNPATGNYTTLCYLAGEYGMHYGSFMPGYDAVIFFSPDNPWGFNLYSMPPNPVDHERMYCDYYLLKQIPGPGRQPNYIYQYFPAVFYDAPNPLDGEYPYENKNQYGIMVNAIMTPPNLFALQFYYFNIYWENFTYANAIQTNLLYNASAIPFHGITYDRSHNLVYILASNNKTTATHNTHNNKALAESPYIVYRADLVANKTTYYELPFPNKPFQDGSIIYHDATGMIFGVWSVGFPINTVWVFTLDPATGNVTTSISDYRTLSKCYGFEPAVQDAQHVLIACQDEYSAPNYVYFNIVDQTYKVLPSHNFGFKILPGPLVPFSS